MRSKFITDPQDPFGDGTLGPLGERVSPNLNSAAFVPAAGHDYGSPSAVLPPVTLPPLTPIAPVEAVQAQSAQNGSGGTGSVVAETSGGIIFNLIYDAAAMAAPASFRAGIQQAASILSATITNKITVNINIDYSGTGGGAAAGPDNGLFENYSTVRSDLISTAVPGDTTFNALPTGSTIQGQSSVAVWNAQLKLFGLLGPNDTTTDDGSATFATDIQSSLLAGVALHELTHALGRVPYGSQPDIFDFYRFTSPGTQLIANGNTAPAAYFSVDGGNTKLADLGQTSDPSDFLNSGVQGGNDPFNEFYTGSTLQNLTTVDKELLDALGFNTAAPVTTVIEAFGSTKLVQVGSNYFLDNISSGQGPELKYAGAAVFAGQLAPYVPVGAEQTAGGYEVAFENAGANLFSIWNTDSNGNFLSYAVYSGASTALESLETSFHQDLNGDGVIGIPVPVTIEAFGSTSLVQLGADFFFDNISSGSGPELKYNGAPVFAGQFAPYVPVGVEQTATGYEVALKNAGANLFSIWNTDSNGNFLSYAVYSGASTALESLETSFHQDLNGDGTIGVVTTVIEALGSTSLTEVGNNYFLDSISSGTGPELKYAGVPVVAGQFAPYVPVGVEQTAGGYEVALKDAGANLFSIWNTDSNGNFLSYAVYWGSSTALETLETSFRQDLNGDGTIGVVTTVMEALGSTSLTEVGNNYFLDSISSGTGPELKYNGAPVVDGQFAPYVPIGVEQTAGGYEVTFKNSGANLFSIWNTDSNGNFLSYAVYSGTSTALESLETSFHQDLNGDGVIGVPTTQQLGVVPSASASQAAPVTVVNNDTFAFRPDLSAGAVPITEALGASEFGGSSPVLDHQMVALIQSSQSPSMSLHEGFAPADIFNHDPMHGASGGPHTDGFLIR